MVTLFGSCYVTIDPSRQAPYALRQSQSRLFVRTEAVMDFDSVARFIDLFRNGRREAVLRLAQRQALTTWMWCAGGCEGSGLSRIRRTGYPTLCRSHASPIQFRTDLEITRGEIRVRTKSEGQDPGDDLGR